MRTRIFYLFGLLLVTGCGSRTGNVSGTVTYKGEKVPSGTVSFISGGKLFHGEIEDGQYEVKRVPLGEYVVTVVREDPNQPNPYDAVNNARKQMIERKAANPKAIDPKIVTDTLELDALQKKRQLLPFYYSSPATSNLRWTVIGGSHTFNIELQETSKRE